MPTSRSARPDRQLNSIHSFVKQSRRGTFPKTLRGIPQEILIGASGGLGIDSVASSDNLTAIGKDRLGERIGSVPEARYQIGRAMAAVADC